MVCGVFAAYSTGRFFSPKRRSIGGHFWVEKVSTSEEAVVGLRKTLGCEPRGGLLGVFFASKSVDLGRHVPCLEWLASRFWPTSSIKEVETRVTVPIQCLNHYCFGYLLYELPPRLRGMPFGVISSQIAPEYRPWSVNSAHLAQGLDLVMTSTGPRGSGSTPATGSARC